MKIFSIEKMSTDLVFNIVLISADGNKYPIKFVSNPNNNGELVLKLNEPGKNAIFVVENISQYQQQNPGFFLGSVIYPKILLPDGKYYLLLNDNGIYNLSTQITDSVFSFVLNNPNLNWNTPDSLDNITINNMSIQNINTDIVGYEFASINGSSTNTLTYSVSNCMNDPALCGPDACPENFVFINDKCIPNEISGIPFGVRLSNGIYTYKIMKGDLVAAVVNPNNITTSDETDNTVKERWFYIDTLNPEIGGSYPIYIVANGVKYYINTPVLDGKRVKYSLTTEVGPNTARFNPTKIINYQDEVTLDQLTNFIIPNSDSFLLWNYHNSRLVSGTCENCPNSSVTTTPNYNFRENNITIPVYVNRNQQQQQNESVWTQLWFWLLIVLGIIIIMSIVIGIVYYSTNNEMEVNKNPSTGIQVIEPK